MSLRQDFINRLSVYELINKQKKFPVSMIHVVNKKLYFLEYIIHIVIKLHSFGQHCTNYDIVPEWYFLTSIQLFI